MASSINHFRSQLNGFNRTDVVQFIQKLTIEHEKTTRQLQDENTRLNQELESLRNDAARLRQANETLTAELSVLLANPTPAPDTVEAPTPVAEEPMQPITSVVPASPPAPDFNEMELAAYRRAELTERMARERAAASVQRMQTAFSQAQEKLALSNQDMATLIDTFRADFSRLEQLLCTTQGIFDESTANVKAAAEVCGEA